MFRPVGYHPQLPLRPFLKKKGITHSPRLKALSYNPASLPNAPSLFDLSTFKTIFILESAFMIFLR